MLSLISNRYVKQLGLWDWAVFNRLAELLIVHGLELLDIDPFSECSCLSENVTSALESWGTLGRAMLSTGENYSSDYYKNHYR